MVETKIDNDPVSVLVGPGQSVTVPANETWKVNIQLGNTGGGTVLRLDSFNFEFFSRNNNAGMGTQGMEMVLEGGITVKESLNDVNSGFYISGFVVSD